MVRVRDDGGDLTPYYDELDRRKAEKLRRKALARERRGTLARFVEGAFIWTSIVLTLPLWLVVGGVVWILGRDPLYKTIRYHYGNDFTASAIMVAIVGWVVAICASTVIYWNSTQTFCERHAGNLACIQMDIDKQQADLNKLRSKQDK